MSLSLFVRKNLYLTLRQVDKILGRKTGIIVICYHSVSDKSNWRHSISLATFKKQIAYLNEKYNIISVDDIHQYLEGKKTLPFPSVLITLDDGYKDNLDLIDIFKEYNIKPLIFLVSNPRSVKREELNNDLPLMNTQEMKKLVEAGWDIGSHGKTHRNFANADIKDLKKEIKGSKHVLEEKLGNAIKYFSYPKGNYNGEISKIVEDSNYEMVFTMDDSNLDKNTNPYAIPRIGIDRSHTFEEFTATISPSVITFRNIVKSLFPKHLIERFIK